MDGSQDYVAREAIRHCLARLARGEDRRDAALISASYWPDARLDFGMFKGDFDAYLAWVVPGADAIPSTQHMIGQSYIELSGDTARSETQAFIHHRIDTGAEHRDLGMGGRYLDRLEWRRTDTGGEWRIVSRTMLYDWVSDWGVAADWAQGIMGTPFSAEHFSGRAHGDYSVKFFAGED